MDRNLTAGIEWPWKLIESTQGDRMLYQLDSDPREEQTLHASEAGARIREAVEALQATIQPPDPKSPRSMSPEAREHLRELGYLE